MHVTPFFSIIMPVYGVEKYLPTAINSVLNQSFDDFELILVDDCSLDECPKICDEYAKKDKRIKVVHLKQNVGLGEARNQGFNNATGQYVFFFDSDDFIVATALETIKSALETDTEILTFGLIKATENKKCEIVKTEKLFCDNSRAQGKKEAGQLFLKLTNARIFPFAWNKVYKRQFLLECNAKFETVKLIEDFLYNIYVFEKAQKITTIHDCLYNYRKPAHQTLASAYSPLFFELAKRKFMLEAEFLKNTDNDNYSARQIILYSHLKHIISCFLRNRSKSANLTKNEQKRLIGEVLNDQTTIDMLKEFVPGNMAIKFICRIFKERKINMCYLFIACLRLLKKQ